MTEKPQFPEEPTLTTQLTLPLSSETLTIDLSIKSETKEYSDLIVKCECLLGRAGIYHYATDSCAEEDTESIEDAAKEAATNATRGRGRPPKEDHELTDPVSAGRKRAEAKVDTNSRQYKGSQCEWKFLKFAGGGPKPIFGCTGYPASNLHHGPDKSTLNNSRPEDVGDNEPYNLHFICTWCHNRWHYANNKYYGANGGEDRPLDNGAWVPLVDYKEHDPVAKMTKEEAFMIESARSNEKLPTAID